ncbi:ParA family protein [Haloarculaceae archaeon H-GB2-1]|nr:ParA family protein [Haloarculaceae archaeon H-GB1-1]MEA5388418.1 ParA family protein [Haloarculaceae archaeon H-GB11]MEA5406455.1 ParA family protein [Haloarculaceae archaeon H-GB2-1]
MADVKSTLALVGATGGAGTTRLAVEMGAMLARDGRDVAIFDASFATQGLAAYVDGRLSTDLTHVLADDEPASAVRSALPIDAAGSLSAYPCAAPFERLARAKTAGAARRFESAIIDVAGSVDHVLLDVPPIAANQAVAAVAAAERHALVAPPSERGADGVARQRARLADVGVDAGALLVNAGVDTEVDDHPLDADATATIPSSDVTTASDAPVSHVGTEQFSQALASATAATLDVTLDVEFEEDGLLDGRLG